MRISDWSSDVFSSDLARPRPTRPHCARAGRRGSSPRGAAAGPWLGIREGSWIRPPHQPTPHTDATTRPALRRTHAGGFKVWQDRKSVVYVKSVSRLNRGCRGIIKKNNILQQNI